jgi:hypothetical protein
MYRFWAKGLCGFDYIYILLCGIVCYIISYHTFLKFPGVSIISFHENKPGITSCRFGFDDSLPSLCGICRLGQGRVDGIYVACSCTSSPFVHLLPHSQSIHRCRDLTFKSAPTVISDYSARQNHGRNRAGVSRCIRSRYIIAIRPRHFEWILTTQTK